MLEEKINPNDNGSNRRRKWRNRMITENIMNAQGTLDFFIQLNSRIYESEPDIETAILDLMTNLMHLTKDKGLDAHSISNMAYAQFTDEKD